MVSHGIYVMPWHPCNSHVSKASMSVHFIQDIRIRVRVTHSSHPLYISNPMASIQLIGRHGIRLQFIASHGITSRPLDQLHQRHHLASRPFHRHHRSNGIHGITSHPLDTWYPWLLMVSVSVVVSMAAHQLDNFACIL